MDSLPPVVPLDQVLPLLFERTESHFRRKERSTTEEEADVETEDL
jgi:hypothetical protein